MRKNLLQGALRYQALQARQRPQVLWACPWLWEKMKTRHVVSDKVMSLIVVRLSARSSSQGMVAVQVRTTTQRSAR
jgi:hypothetical protein